MIVDVYYARENNVENTNTKCHEFKSMVNLLTIV